MLRRNCALATIAFALTMHASTDAEAMAQRTFVASTGSDSNPCNIAEPCRGFARAITQTSSGGEVIVLDSAGYGPVTITQSVSIIAPTGVFAGISVFSGDGITISGAGLQVVLRGLAINGLGGTNGIVIAAAADVEIANCTVSKMTVGLSTTTTGRLLVRNSLFQHNLSGIEQYGGGSGTYAHVVIRENTYGIGISHSTATLIGSTIEHNQGYGVVGVVAYITARDLVIQQNDGEGVLTQDGYLRLSNSLVTANGSYAVNLSGTTKAWLVGNSIYDNLQIVANNSEICACGTGSVVYLSGNSITSGGAAYAVDGLFGVVTSWGNNAFNGATHGNFSTIMLR